MAQPQFVASHDTLTFTAAQGANPAPQTDHISSDQSPTEINFAVASDQPWLSALPDAGATPQDLTVSIDVTGLEPGTYHGNITVSPVLA